MQAKHGWSDSTWNQIDFSLFGQHFKRLRPHHQVTHMKRVHGQLPLGIQRYRQSREKDPVLKLCPCCKTADETSEHRLRCTANPSFIPSLQQLRKDLSPGGKHPVRKLIADGIEGWSRTGSSLESDLSLYPEHLRDTISSASEDQGCIGWGQAAHGFLSKTWTHLACKDMLRHDRHESDVGLRRMRSIISAISGHSTRIWLARNEKLHSNEGNVNRDIRSTELAEIKALHG